MQKFYFLISIHILKYSVLSKKQGKFECRVYQRISNMFLSYDLKTIKSID